MSHLFFRRRDQCQRKPEKDAPDQAPGSVRLDERKVSRSASTIPRARRARRARAFVAAGLEQSVANMHYLPYGLLIKELDPAFAALAGSDLQGLPRASFLPRNLLPVTLGNSIGGGVPAAAVHWFIYLRAVGAPREAAPHG